MPDKIKNRDKGLLPSFVRCVELLLSENTNTSNLVPCLCIAIATNTAWLPNFICVEYNYTYHPVCGNLQEKSE